MRDKYEALIKYLAKKWDLTGCSQIERKGCTEEQLLELMKAQHVNYLPELYRQFMYEFGVNDGGLMEVGKFTFKYAISFKKHWATKAIPSSAYIFFSDFEHFAFFFFTDIPADDPLIYRIAENPEHGNLEFSEYTLLSKFLVQWMDDVMQNC